MTKTAHVLTRVVVALLGMIVQRPDVRTLPRASKGATDPLQALVSLLQTDRRFTVLLQGAVDLGVIDWIRGVIRI